VGAAVVGSDDVVADGQAESAACATLSPDSADLQETG
jgi:hypothetical protein